MRKIVGSFSFYFTSLHYNFSIGGSRVEGEGEGKGEDPTIFLHALDLNTWASLCHIIEFGVETFNPATLKIAQCWKKSSNLQKTFFKADTLKEQPWKDLKIEVKP